VIVPTLELLVLVYLELFVEFVEMEELILFVVVVGAEKLNIKYEHVYV